MTPPFALETSDTSLREMAHSLRSRHFHQLLIEWRRAVNDLIEARRSRQRRARLIWLARRRGFTHCLRKLRSPGMTIVTYGDNCAFSIQASAMQFHLARLRSRIASLKQLYAEMKATPVEPIIANLRTLLEEAEVIRNRPLEVRFTVGSVELGKEKGSGTFILMKSVMFPALPRTRFCADGRPRARLESRHAPTVSSPLPALSGFRPQF